MREGYANIALTAVTILLLSFYTTAQDVHFSGNQLAPLYVNPGLTGSRDISVNAIYRNQWRRIGDPFQTIYTSAEFPVHIKRKNKPGGLGIGIDFYNDRSGSPNVNNSQVNLHLAYHLYLSEKTSFSGGIYGGYKQLSVSPNSGKWGSQHNGYFYDSAIPSGESWIDGTAHSIDVGTGFVFTQRRNKRRESDHRSNRLFSLGIAFYHVNQPNLSMLNDEAYRLPMRFSSFANANLLLGSRFLLSPQIYIQVQSPFNETMLGANLRYTIKEQLKSTSMVSDVLASYVALGFYYRSNDAVVLRATLDYSNYSIGFSYDITVSQLQQTVQSKGAMEVSLRYRFPQSNNRAFY